MRADECKASNVRASLISAPEGGSPLFPVWRISADDDVVLIGPDENVSRSMSRMKP